MRPLSPFKPSAGAMRSASLDEGAAASSSKGKARAIHLDVLLEGADEANGFAVPEPARRFLAGLGDVLHEPTSRSPGKGPATPSRRETNPVALKNTLTELLTTERSYVRRIKTLHTAYAVPLRASAKAGGRNPMGLTGYEANSLFSNIERIVAINEAFLRDLEAAVPRGDASWADALQHHLALFEPYNVYVSNYPTAKEIERRLAGNATFVRFCENVQYSPTAEVGNAGLRDLLAEPFQRIARYPLLIIEMLKQLAADDPLRPTLVAASRSAADVARNTHDEVARRTEELIALSEAIADFPKTLVNGSRRFIAALDVKDVPAPSSPALHATLFLFSDLLVIVKRPPNDKGRVLAGLERGPAHSPLKGSLRSSGLAYRGHVALNEVTAVDDGVSFGLHFERPPLDVGAKWSGRATRRCFAEAVDKRAFLAALWLAQAQLRVRPGLATVLSTSLHALDFRADSAKPCLIVDATRTSSETWDTLVRRRGDVGRDERRTLGDAALAHSLAQTVLQAGMCDVPPRHALQPVTAAPPSPQNHRRALSNASRSSHATTSSAVSSFMSSLRESTPASTFSSTASGRPDLDSMARDDAMEVIGSPRKAARADGVDGPGEHRRAVSDTPSVPAPASAGSDIFGPTLPLSPRSRTPLGPRAPPTQRPTSTVARPSSPEATPRKVSDKRPREEPDAPASPGSTHVRKRATPPLSRAPTTHSHSPGVRSPLGLHSPRRASSHGSTSSSTGDLLRDIDGAIDDAAARSDSMQDLRQTVNTFVLPADARSVADRSIVASGSGLTRSPNLAQLAAGETPRASQSGALASFRAEVNDKLNALLGGWEQTTQQYRSLADAHKAERAAHADALAARDARIAALEAQIAALATTHAALNDEVHEIYNAVNAELDRIFDEAKLPPDAAFAGLQREFHRKTADEVVLKFRVKQLEARLAARES